jgi:hypothetical protein
MNQHAVNQVQSMENLKNMSNHSRQVCFFEFLYSSFSVAFLFRKCSVYS